MIRCPKCHVTCKTENKVTHHGLDAAAGVSIMFAEAGIWSKCCNEFIGGKRVEVPVPWDEFNHQGSPGLKQFHETVLYIEQVIPAKWDRYLTANSNRRQAWVMVGALFQFIIVCTHDDCPPYEGMIREGYRSQDYYSEEIKRTSGGQMKWNQELKELKEEKDRKEREKEREAEDAGI